DAAREHVLFVAEAEPLRNGDRRDVLGVDQRDDPRAAELAKRVVPRRRARFGCVSTAPAIMREGPADLDLGVRAGVAHERLLPRPRVPDEKPGAADEPLVALAHDDELTEAVDVEAAPSAPDPLHVLVVAARPDVSRHLGVAVNRVERGDVTFDRRP